MLPKQVEDELAEMQKRLANLSDFGAYQRVRLIVQHADQLLQASRTAREANVLVPALLKHVARCGVCLRPATYQRALTMICDVCAADPSLDWARPKAECELAQAAVVRQAETFLKTAGVA